MTRFDTGLVVGKFAPLHRGHALLLDEALRQCRHLVILSYSKPELPGCGPARREQWLRALYPGATRRVLDDARLAEWCDAHGHARVVLPPNEAPDDLHRRFCAWVLAAILQIRVDAVFTSEAYGEGFARVLGVLQGSGVVHVEVDRARARVPASGTQVRSDVHAHRHLLPPRVYADFVERIVLLGGESTGKTTLAQALAGALQTVWVPEYGRELWERRGGRLAFGDMSRIARTQQLREDRAAETARRFLVCDTGAMTTQLYSQALFGRVSAALRARAARPYDHVFLCQPDFGFVQDGTRRDAAFQREQQAWYEAELARQGIPYRRLAGPVSRRVREALAALGVGQAHPGVCLADA